MSKSKVKKEVNLLGTSTVTDTVKVELFELKMSQGKETAYIFQFIVNGDYFMSVDNRAFALFLFNNFDFNEYLKDIVSRCNYD